jgi:hypothetical protein
MLYGRAPKCRCAKLAQEKSDSRVIATPSGGSSESKALLWRSKKSSQTSSENAGKNGRRFGKSKIK